MHGMMCNFWNSENVQQLSLRLEGENKDSLLQVMHYSWKRHFLIKFNVMPFYEEHRKGCHLGKVFNLKGDLFMDCDG